MGFSDYNGNNILQVMGPELASGAWIEKSQPTVRTDPHMTDSGSVVLLRYFPAGINAAMIPGMLVGQKYDRAGLYIVSVDAEMLTPTLVQATCNLEGCISPKSVKRTFCGSRKEIAANNPTYIKKLQAEYPSYQDEWLEGPGSNPVALGNPSDPAPFWWTSDKLIINEPFGWVTLGDDFEQIPNTPFTRRTVKKQWFWEREPGN